MSKQFFLVKGGKKLKGEVEISGYKNSAGAVLAATLLSEKPSIVGNLPLVSDVLNLIEIIKKMGADVEWLDKRKVKIVPKSIDPNKIPADIFEKMRVSVLLLGPLLSRFNRFKVPHPGGDQIGLRPIDSHLDAFRSFGANIKKESGYYFLETPKIKTGKNIVLREFSVTATENAIMMAAGMKGKTKIEIAACEPQVQDLAEFLRRMGISIKGAGTHTIEIEGKENIKGAELSICPDLLEAGTFMIAFALTEGKGIIKNVMPEHLSFFFEKMREIGLNFEVKKNSILLKKSGKFKAAKIQIMPYPGFPTDLQPQTSVLLTQAEGKSLVHDPLYENRFNHLHDLRQMGADIEITDPHRALIFGKTKLFGNKINAPDIRGGSSLLLAGLIAKGQTLIENVYQIDRGHENLDEKLRSLGADIKRV